ncbi:MAG: PHB depolymerase family esterase [Pseudomonadota bacterium]|nr:PHB depolymerase family esterase [Pseudomonadota bacterium]
MTTLTTIDMAEATRLTREGRLDEAMAVLRGARFDAASATGSAAASPTPSAHVHPIIDLRPPSIATGSAWTSPPAIETPAGVRPARVRAPHVSKPLRGFLDRLRPAGGARGLGGSPAAATARAPLSDGARFDERSYANAAGSRSYKLYIPSGYSGQPLPLVVMLHGCSQSPDDFAAGTRMNELAEQQGFLVAYPAQTPSANASKCWNWFSSGDQQRDRGEPSLIAGITREVMRDFAVEPGRVYVAGLSAGGAAAAIMGATYPDLYAAIGVHSGLACGAASDMPSAFAAMRQGGATASGRTSPHGAANTLPTIVFHGDRDTTVNPVNGDHVIAQSKAAAALTSSVSTGKSAGGIGYTRTVQVGSSGKTLLEHWVLHGAGHAWSGGDAAGSYTEPRGPDASAEMLRFFLQHRAVPTQAS